MTTLTPKANASHYHRMCLNGVTPLRLQGLTHDEISQLTIKVDDRPAALGEWWNISDITAEALQLIGDCGRCDTIGGQMDGGTLRVSGNVGDSLADNMRSGSLLVSGNAGRYAAGNLRGGHVEILGDAAEYAASAKPGKSTGMRGGTLIIHGACDRWLAARLRRGTVIAHGSVAAGCAAYMLAGTVVLTGLVESPVGCGMRRGTLLITSPDQTIDSRLLPGFTVAEECELSYLPLLLNAIAPHLDPQTVATIQHQRVVRCMGDRAVAGLGELIGFVSSPPIKSSVQPT